MKVKVVKNHPSDWNIVKFPTFPKGTTVTLTGGEDTDFKQWYPAVIEGHETFVPQSFVCDGKLARDYNPTEITAKVGEILELREIVNAWLIVTNNENITSWIPAECVVSV